MVTESKKKLPFLDIQDKEKSFDHIRTEINFISNRMVGLGLEYINKVSGQFKSTNNDHFFRLRNSIQYRLGAILFHFTLLLDIQNRFQSLIDKDPFNKEESIKCMVLGSEQQYSLFDSIVFHIISLFDYLGNLIDYIFCGKFQSRLKWNGVIKISYTNNSAISKLELKNIIQKWHSNFINILYSHRSHLIHYKMDFGAISFTLDLGKSKAKLRIGAPHLFLKNFRYLNEKFNEYKIGINYATDWLINQSLEATKEIINSISVSMEENRKIPKEKEIFIFKKNDHQ